MNSQNSQDGHAPTPTQDRFIRIPTQSGRHPDSTPEESGSENRKQVLLFGTVDIDWAREACMRVTEVEQIRKITDNIESRGATVWTLSKAYTAMCFPYARWHKPFRRISFDPCLPIYDVPVEFNGFFDMVIIDQGIWRPAHDSCLVILNNLEKLIRKGAAVLFPFVHARYWRSGLNPNIYEYDWVEDLPSDFVTSGQREVCRLNSKMPTKPPSQEFEKIGVCYGTPVFTTNRADSNDQTVAKVKDEFAEALAKITLCNSESQAKMNYHRFLEDNLVTLIETDHENAVFHTRGTQMVVSLDATRTLHDFSESIVRMRAFAMKCRIPFKVGILQKCNVVYN